MVDPVTVMVIVRPDAEGVEDVGEVDDALVVGGDEVAGVPEPPLLEHAASVRAAAVAAAATVRRRIPLYFPLSA
jgi:hypothetical protein